MSPSGRGGHHLVTLSGGFGLGLSAMQGFLVPLRAHELGASPVEIGVLVAAGSVVQAVLSIPLGRLTDRLGARRGFALGAAGVALAASLAGIAADLHTLLLAHVLFGVARAWGWIASQSYMAGHGARADLLRRSGRFAFSAGVAAFVGPSLIGVVAGRWSFGAAFFVISAAATAFVLVAVALPGQPDVDSHVRSATSSGSVRGLLRRPGVTNGVLLSAVDLWVHTIWMAFVPVALLEAGLPTAVIGTVVSAKAIGGTVGALTTPWTERTPLPRAVVGGFLLVAGAIGLGISGSVVGVPWTHVVAVVVGVAGGVTTPLSIALVSDDAGHLRTTALGLRATTNQLSATVAPLAMGEVLGIAAVGVAFPVAAGVALGVLLVGLVGPLRRRPVSAVPAIRVSP